MKRIILRILLCAGIGMPFHCLAQQPSLASKVRAQLLDKTGQVYRKKLPADLPKEKMLFIKFNSVSLPTERPKAMSKADFKRQAHHNSVFTEANRQLQTEAAKYPFAYHITTQDSIAYYREHGYKYMLFHNSFNSFLDGNYTGTSSSRSSQGVTSTSTYVDLYVRNLTNNDLYILDDFSETFIYYYKGLVGMLLKKTAKQFKTSKS